MNIQNLVEDVINEIGSFDLVIDPSERPGASSYMRNHQHEYIRTLRDIFQYRPPAGSVRVLEIGSFFGVVSVGLSKLGYSVTASDIPEYIDLPDQVNRYAKHGIATRGLRLQDYTLPFKDGSFDVVIMCEVLEHLNFNPVPLIKEINRVLSKGGIFYLSLPNYAQIRNRFKVIRGQSVGISVESFFEQLRPGSQVIVYGHWKEYTASETKSLLAPMGFKIAKQYYFGLSETTHDAGLRKILGRLFYRLFPQMKENSTTIAVKETDSILPLRIPETVHPTLRNI